MLQSEETRKSLAEMEGLYEKDPERFEQLRQELIERTIANFPIEHQRRAKGLQFVIEAQLRRYKDPVVRMNKMVEIFWEYFQAFPEVLSNPTRVIEERERRLREGRVIPLRPPKEYH